MKEQPVNANDVNYHIEEVQSTPYISMGKSACHSNPYVLLERKGQQDKNRPYDMQSKITREQHRLNTEEGRVGWMVSEGRKGIESRK